MTIHRQANTEPGRLREGRRGVRRERQALRLPGASAHATRARRASRIELPANVEQIEPLGYLEMLAFVAEAEAVLTDSGGLQKEAYWLGVPCVTVRPNAPEWVATVEVGANTLVEPEAMARALDEAHFPDDAPQLYGDAHASERIAGALYFLTARVGEHRLGFGHEREHLEVAERLDRPDVRPELDAVRVEHVSRARVDREDESPCRTR